MRAFLTHASLTVERAPAVPWRLHRPRDHATRARRDHEAPSRRSV